MRASNILGFRQTAEALLKRPWKKDRDGTLFYGSSKSGNKRLPLSTKQGNKNFYKGTRSSGIGHMSMYGKYTIDYNRVRTFVVPASLDECVLKPLVSANTPVPRNDFSGYSLGAVDGKLYVDKVKEFVETGKIEFPLSDTYVERG